MNEPELKPCPFCGGKAYIWSWNGGARVQCDNWCARSGNEHFISVGAKTREAVIKKWNERASECK